MAGFLSPHTHSRKSAPSLNVTSSVLFFQFFGVFLEQGFLSLTLDEGDSPCAQATQPRWLQRACLLWESFPGRPRLGGPCVCVCARGCDMLRQAVCMTWGKEGTLR